MYLILQGRISCLANRSICFKTYIEGGYFGEIELFKNCPRMFTVRAECSTTVLEVSEGVLDNLMRSYPEYKSKLVERTLQRYMLVKRAKQKIKKFEMIPKNDQFWEVEFENEAEFGNELSKWIDQWKKMREDAVSDDASSILSYRINRSKASKKAKSNRRRGQVFNNSQLSRLSIKQFQVVFHKSREI